MTTKIKIISKVKKYLSGINEKDSRRVYIYSVIAILASFLFSILQYFFFPPDYKNNVLVPNLYGNTENYSNNSKQIEVKMGKIIKEMQNLKVKNENGQLDSSDSIRLKYLYNEYQKLKNGF